MKETYPRICVAHPSIFSALEIERYEAEIISNPSATEHDVSRFFAIYPKVLLLGEGKEVRRETVLFGSDDNPIGRVDFFRRSFGQLRWDIVELKRPHIEFMFNVLLPKASELMFFPPGYMSVESLQRVLAHKKGNAGGMKIEQMVERGIILCGSPDTVRKQITLAHHEMGFQEFMTMLMFGDMPAALSDKNIRLFAAEVLPVIQGLTDRDYRGFEVKKPALAAAK